LSRQVEIKILGQTYKVKAAQDEAQLLEVAQYVDAKLSELIRGGRPASMGPIIIGTLNIANEYFMYKRHVEAKLAAIEERTNKLQALLKQKSEESAK